MRLLPAILVLSALPALAADPKLESLLKSVESRYNKAKTLQVLFTENYTPLGKARMTENGTLLLRKPGKMRWNYDKPKGKLMISDGKFMWLYTPDDNRAEHQKLQESDDMRAPIAFLLGKLNFQREFRNLKGTPEGADMRVAADPKSEDMAYKRVEFLIAPDGRIRAMKVTGADQSLFEITLDQEKVDPVLDPKLFEFQPPKGVEVVEGQ